MASITLISGEVNQGMILHVWDFAAALVEDPTLTEGWSNVQILTSEVPPGTSLVTDEDGLGQQMFALLPDGSRCSARDFAKSAKRVL